jgi:hypothetical protein
MRLRPVLVLLALCLQACSTFIVQAKPPGEVLAELPHSVRVTTNEGRTVVLGKPVQRNGYVVDAGRDSVRLADVKQVEVAKPNYRRTALLVGLVVAASFALRAATGAAELADDPSTVVPVLLRSPP